MVCCAELYANVEYVELDDEIDLIADNFIFEEEEELEIFDPRRLLHILPPIPGEQEEFEWEEVEEEVEEEFEEEVEEEDDSDVVQYQQTRWLSNILSQQLPWNMQLRMDEMNAALQFLDEPDEEVDDNSDNEFYEESDEDSDEIYYRDVD